MTWQILKFRDGPNWPQVNVCNWVRLRSCPHNLHNEIGTQHHCYWLEVVTRDAGRDVWCISWMLWTWPEMTQEEPSALVVQQESSITTVMGLVTTVSSVQLSNQQCHYWPVSLLSRCHYWSVSLLSQCHCWDIVEMLMLDVLPYCFPRVENLATGGSSWELVVNVGENTMPCSVVHDNDNHTFQVGSHLSPPSMPWDKVHCYQHPLLL